MAKESAVPKTQAIPKLMVYFSTEQTDKHWEDFENFFFGLDASKPKPERYLEAKFDKDEFKYKMTAFIYWLIFNPESVPEGVRKDVEKWAGEAMKNSMVAEKMETLEQCMSDFFKLIEKHKEGHTHLALPTTP